MERKDNGYWTYERCREEALKYISSSELQRKCSSVYNKIYINGWNELTQHFIKIGNRYKRLVYVYEFSDNFFYVGLTGNINRRMKQHVNDINSSVYKHSNLTKLNPNLLIVSDYIDVDNSIELEKLYLEKYIKDGWNSLNKVKTGNIGSCNIKWNKEECFKESIKYLTITDYQRNSKSSYNTALKNGWIDEICSHMKRRKCKNGEYDNKNKCSIEARKYKSKSEFHKNNWSAWNYSKKNGWLDEFYN